MRTRVSNARCRTGVAASRCGSRRTTSHSPRTARSAAKTTASNTHGVAVADVLDGARAADASEEELDAFIQQLRVEQCDFVSVITAAAWLAAERARLAHQRGLTLPTPAWATTEEIADDRGAPLSIVAELVQDALSRGLLARQERGVVVTPAGHEYAVRGAAP